MAFRILTHEKERPRHPRQRYRVIKPVLESESARESKSARYRLEGDERKWSGPSTKTLWTLERMQAEIKKFKHRRVLNLVSQSSPTGYKSGQCPESLAVFSSFQKKLQASTGFAIRGL